MICNQQQKTNMPSPLEGSADQSHQQEKPSPPGPTESLEVVPGKHRPKAATEEDRLARRKGDYKRHYYRNQEALKSYAKQHQVKVRSVRKSIETPEEVAARNAYNRAQYEKNKEERRLKRNAYNAKNKINHRSTRLRTLKVWRKKVWRDGSSYRIAALLRGRLRFALKFADAKKSKSALRLVGCSIEELRRHVESQWLEGMDWSNLGIGKGRWNLDHKKPCAAFRLKEPDEQLACFHYSNLSPRWSLENLSKGSEHEGRRWRHSDHACPATPLP